MQAAIDLLVRSIPILIGGGLVQLVIALIKRRAELRALDAATSKSDAESGSVVVSSAERSVALADSGRDYAVQRAEEAVQRAERLTHELAVQGERVRVLTGRLATCEQEVAELRRELAMLQPDHRTCEDPPSV